MKKLYFFGLASLIVCFMHSGEAQATGNNPTDSTTADNGPDPVAEMLDSLITLNNVIRFNQVKETASDGDATDRPATYPHYSEQVYRQRISKINSPVPLTYNDQVSRYIDLYAYRKRDLTSRVMGLSELYFPLFEEVLDREGLPLELKYLAIVESALNPTAVSRVGATGLWQFMYNTGKIYGLKINSYYDERRDPVRSTEAACQYFKDMYEIYGDWLLVIAAYNCGAGNVNKAIRRSGGKTDFWEISHYLPRETRGYVPAFVAVCYVMHYSAEHFIFPVEPSYNYFEVDTVSVPAGITLTRISEAIDLPYDVLEYLNPVYKRGMIPAVEKEAYLRLPVMKISDYIDAERNLFAPLVAESEHGDSLTVDDRPFTYEYKRVKDRYYIRSGDNLSVIAARNGCSVADLKKWNGLKSNNIYPGRTLAIYHTKKVKVYIDPPAEEVQKDAATAKQSTAGNRESSSSLKVVYHMVQKGDTLWNIARKYDGVTVEQLKELNQISDFKSLQPGTRIKVKVNG